MTRVNVVVEGQTERRFVTDVFGPAMAAAGVYLYPRLLGPAGQKGGRVTFDRVAADLSILLKQEADTYCTTLLDYYGRGRGWPPVPVGQPASAAATVLERALADRLSDELPDRRVDVRCFPYIQLHEFESLLFSDSAAFARAVGRDDLAGPFAEIRSEFATPEDIDDGPSTAPSKRVIALHPKYDKVLAGQQAAVAVGVSSMRQACPRFGRWVDRLLSLATPGRDR